MDDNEININRRVHEEIEGECAHEWIMAEITRGRRLYEGFCKKCGTPKQGWETDDIDCDYLADDAYCLKIFKENKFHAIPHHFEDGMIWGVGVIERTYFTAAGNCQREFHDYGRDKDLNRAILLAALKRNENEKNTGGFIDDH